jgi:hypothetical protein
MMTSTKPTQMPPQRRGIASGKRIVFQAVTRRGDPCQAPTQAIIRPLNLHTSNQHKHPCAEGCGWSVPCYEAGDCQMVRVCKSCLDGIYI